MDYTYVDSYLIAGPDIATLSKAILTAKSDTLTHSLTFFRRLLKCGDTNFSAILITTSAQKSAC